MPFIRPDDVVPSIRHDVFFTRPPNGIGEEPLGVINLKNGEELRLRGFEYSLARMLDGHRTAKEVLENAERIGLPLTLSGLEGFVKKLHTYDLVTNAPEPDAYDGSSPWDSRIEWDAQTREQYQKALRRDRAAPHFAHVFAQTDLSWSQGPLSASEARAVPRATPAPRAATAAAIAIAALGVAAAVALIVPFPRTARLPVLLTPLTQAMVAAPRAGKIEAVNARANQWVEQGDVLFTLEVSQTQAELQLAKGRLERQQRELLIWTRNEPQTRDASARHDRAEAAVARAQAELERSRLDRDNPVEEQTAEQQLLVALGDLNDAEAEIDAELPAEEHDALRAARADVQRLEVALLDSEVKAPRSGVLTHFSAAPGQELTPGVAVGQLDNTRTLKAEATIDTVKYAGVKVGSPARLRFGDRAIDVNVTRVNGSKVELDVDNAAQTLATGVAELEIKLPPKPLFRLGR